MVNQCNRGRYCSISVEANLSETKYSFFFHFGESVKTVHVNQPKLHIFFLSKSNIPKAIEIKNFIPVWMQNCFETLLEGKSKYANTKMDAECKAIEKKMQSEVDQFKSIQKGKRNVRTL